MTVLLLVLLALLIGFAAVLVFVQPWFDVRTVDWQSIAEDFSKGYQSQHDEVER